MKPLAGSALPAPVPCWRLSHHVALWLDDCLRVPNDGETITL